DGGAHAEDGPGDAGGSEERGIEAGAGGLGERGDRRAQGGQPDPAGAAEGLPRDGADLDFRRGGGDQDQDAGGRRGGGEGDVGDYPGIDRGIDAPVHGLGPQTGIRGDDIRLDEPADPQKAGTGERTEDL